MVIGAKEVQHDVAPGRTLSPVQKKWSKASIMNTSEFLNVNNAWLVKLGQLLKFPSKGFGLESVEKTKIAWLVKLRWAALSFFSVLVLPGLAFGFLNRESVSFYLGVLGVLLIFNLLTQALVDGWESRWGPLTICAQLTFDLLALFSLLSSSGGFQNPLVSLFLLNVSLGGLLISGRLAWPFLVLTHSAVLILQLQFFSKQGFLPGTWATVILFHLLIGAFWLVMRSLGTYLEEQSHREAKSLVIFERQDRLRAVGALASGFSHEFASPLNAIKIRLERLQRRQGDSEDLKQALGAIESCERVIKNMNSSQLDSRDLHYRQIRLDRFLSDVVDSWREGHPAARVNVQTLAAVRAWVPPINFSQVVLNLLDNAFDSAPEREIEVVLKKSGEGDLVLEVSDLGQGFSSFILERHGEPFLTTKKQGTGLGLYVVELFAQSLGGKLHLENKPGGGALVRLTWPLC